MQIYFIQLGHSSLQTLYGSHVRGETRGRKPGQWLRRGLYFSLLGTILACATPTPSVLHKSHLGWARLCRHRIHTHRGITTHDTTHANSSIHTSLPSHTAYDLTSFQYDNGSSWHSETAGSRLARSIASHRIKTTTYDSGVEPIITSGQAGRHLKTGWNSLHCNEEQHINAWHHLCSICRGKKISVWREKQVKYGFQLCLEGPGGCSKTLKAGRGLWDTIWALRCVCLGKASEWCHHHRQHGCYSTSLAQWMTTAHISSSWTRVPLSSEVARIAVRASINVKCCRSDWSVQIGLVSRCCQARYSEMESPKKMTLWLRNTHEYESNKAFNDAWNFEEFLVIKVAWEKWTSP